MSVYINRTNYVEIIVTLINIFSVVSVIGFVLGVWVL